MTDELLLLDRLYAKVLALWKRHPLEENRLRCEAAKPRYWLAVSIA